MKIKWRIEVRLDVVKFPVVRRMACTETGLAPSSGSFDITSDHHSTRVQYQSRHVTLLYLESASLSPPSRYGVSYPRHLQMI